MTGHTHASPRTCTALCGPSSGAWQVQAQRVLALLQCPSSTQHQERGGACVEELIKRQGFRPSDSGDWGIYDLEGCWKGGRGKGEGRKGGKVGFTHGKSKALPGSWWRASPIRFPAHLLLLSSLKTSTSQAQLQTEHDSARGFRLWVEVVRCRVSLHPSFLASLFRTGAITPSIALPLLFEPPIYFTSGPCRGL
jgi:hypothetical protein